ncbi:MAG: SCP2 sterol-binding domain-containing protein [Pseudomonadales bacterium]|jgi:ubiquinone biosynthesis protein UbiJ|tara:strand:+ start:7688 stop:8314 length:627 start_codon:yes stop_codon:yes gene_type:complete
MAFPSSDILDKFLADFVNAICRQAADLDPGLQRKMAPIAGQVIEIRCTNPEKIWHLTLGEKSIELHNGPATSPNVAIQGSAPALFKAMGGSSSEIQIDGDETLLLEVSELVKNFYPDLVTPLAAVLGDKPANKVAAAFEMGFAALSSFASGLGEDIAHNASAKIVERFTTTEAFAHHLAELDALRLRVDRLSAKISQQERSATDNSNQ